MKRVHKQRKIRDTILILTNGKQTEKNYFDSITLHYKSIYSIKCEFKNYQCDELVDYAISLQREEYNQIWCVFDIDDTYIEGHLTYALKTAKENNIGIAYSNEAFEVWLLYHFKEIVSTGLTRKTYGKELNKELSNIDYHTQYKKNDKALIERFFLSKTLTAAENAKKNFQKLESDHQKNNYGNTNYPVWEWRSSTSVYKVIEALQLLEIDNNNTSKE